jgi:acylglycerol lipase
LRAYLPAAGLLLALAACAMPGPSGRSSPVVVWAPPSSPRAVIIAVHGFGDYKAAFAEFGTYAAEHGVLVAAYDQPGFGEDRGRGQWQGTEALVAALDQSITAAHRDHPGLPVFVLGESMGASVAMAALAPRQDAPLVAGLILTAPAVWNGSDLPSAYRTTLRVLSSVLPMLRVSARHVRVQASDNVEMLYALGRDPLYQRYTRLDAVAGLVDLMTESQAVAPKLRLPMLVLLGARDQIVKPTASRRFVATLDPSHCSVATYLEGWHLLLRDHQREEVFADILAWVDGSPLPSGLDHPCGPPAPVGASS